jgi:uncharacterized damage-inducible protein DinB
MPVPAPISAAAAMFKQNGVFLPKSFEGMTTEEWNRRPNETSNSLLWEVGHITWARGRTLHFLGVEWSKPWLNEFARGKSAADVSQYPSAEELVAAWNEGSAALTAALESVTPEALSAPPPEKAPPSTDGTLGGVISFLAYHETYHVGQAAYISRWLGHAQIMG